MKYIVLTVGVHAPSMLGRTAGSGTGWLSHPCTVQDNIDVHSRRGLGIHGMISYVYYALSNAHASIHMTLKSWDRTLTTQIYVTFSGVALFLHMLLRTTCIFFPCLSLQAPTC
jgi:hypothetical protein